MLLAVLTTLIGLHCDQEGKGAGHGNNAAFATGGTTMPDTTPAATTRRLQALGAVQPWLDSSAATLAAATNTVIIGSSTSFWSAIPSSPSSYSVAVGDKLSFRYSSYHNLYLMASAAKYASCDFSGATEIASTSQGGGSPNLYEAVVTAASTLYFACQIGGGSHCLYGQKVTITAASPLASPPPSSPACSATTPATTPCYKCDLKATGCPTRNNGVCEDGGANLNSTPNLKPKPNPSSSPNPSFSPSTNPKLNPTPYPELNPNPNLNQVGPTRPILIVSWGRIVLTAASASLLKSASLTRSRNA